MGRYKTLALDIGLILLLALLLYVRYRGALVDLHRGTSAISSEVFKLMNRSSDGSKLGLEKNGTRYYARIKSSLVTNLSVGDYILMNGTLEALPQPRSPKDFDFGKYLYYQGYSGIIRIEALQAIPLKKQPKRWLEAFRNGKFGKVQAWNWEPQLKGIYAALFLGIRSAVTEDTRANFQSAGIMHLLAISGLHLGIVYLVLERLVALLKRSKLGRVFQFGILLMGLWTFALFTGSGPSVLRAATMFSFIALGHLLKRKSTGYRSLLASALFLFWLDPLLIHQLGFQLSYSAVFGIVYLVPLFNRWHQFKAPIPKNLQQIIYVSIAAQLFTAPLSLYHFQVWPSYFLVSNLLILPLMPILMYSGFLLLIFTDFSFLRSIVQYLLEGLNLLGAEIGSWPHALVPISLDEINLVLFYLLAVIWLWGSRSRIKRSLYIIAFVLIISGAYKVYLKNHRPMRLSFGSSSTGEATLTCEAQDLPLVLDRAPLLHSNFKLFRLDQGLWTLNYGCLYEERLSIVKGHPKGDLELSNTVLYWGDSNSEEIQWQKYCKVNNLDFYSARSSYKTFP